MQKYLSPSPTFPFPFQNSILFDEIPFTLLLLMCKTKSSIVATTPSSRRAPLSTAGTSSSFPASSTSTTTTSSASLAAVRSSLPAPPILYPFQELSASTNNFLSKPHFSSPSPCWRCTLRATETLVYQFPFRSDPTNSLPSLLSRLTQSHHANIAPLLGASLPSPTTHHYIYLVYAFTPNSSPLSSCLRNTHNPSFTPLNSFLSRARIASDLSTGLEYLHLHSSASFHGLLSSSSVLVTDKPSPRAVISLFGATDLTGTSNSDTPLMEEFRNGYLAPELSTGSISASYQSDIFSLGVLLLELLSGEEPVRYRMDRSTNQPKRISIIDKAKKVIREEGTVEKREGRVRKWVDRRLKDSFPTESVEKLIRVALRCVEGELDKRAEITWVAGKVTKVFLEAEEWERRMKAPTDFSVSVGPR
ncbi:hypothetical protein LUZ60_012189 [Juncus effusus]|nr:hypothetical protein LUZ60_012189 [Juncus effusus]